MNKNESEILVACVWLAIFLVVLGVAYEYLRYENRELRAVVVEQQNINNELIGLNEELYKLNDELLKTVDELTKKLNGGE